MCYDIDAVKARQRAKGVPGIDSVVCDRQTQCIVRYVIDAVMARQREYLE